MRLSLVVASLALLAPSLAFGDDLAKGKEIYNGLGACASCHGALGAGDGAAAAMLQPKPRNLAAGDFMYDTDKDGKKGTVTDIYNIVTNGAMAYGGSPMMAARADIPEADRRALAAYVASLHK